MRQQPDEAAIFYLAKALFEIGTKNWDVAKTFQGEDNFARECMRVARAFETWCCQHVDFDQSQIGVWPYEVAEKIPDYLAGIHGILGLALLTEERHWAEAVKLIPGLSLLAQPDVPDAPDKARANRFLEAVAHRLFSLEAKHPGHSHTLLEWLVILEGDVLKAKLAWLQGDMNRASDKVISIAACAVTCAEQNDIPS